MAKTNRERVGEGLELLSRGLAPFIEREMKASYGDGWTEEVKAVLPSAPGEVEPSIEDPHAALILMWNRWNEVFSKTLGHAGRSLVSELREFRNRWAHMDNFSSDDAYRALDSISRLLSSVSAPEAEQVERMKMELLRLRFEEQRRREDRKATAAPIQGQPMGNLKPWREVVTPHPDVASGRYQQAEFAADLWQVYRGEGSDEYRDPTEFFRRTYLTDGLKRLLTNALRRLAGGGGDPVVRLETNFGGGKTHALLALYHLFSGVPPSELPGVEELLAQEGLRVPQGVRRAVFVGTKVSPGQVHAKPDGTQVRTMWGEIAWQLGGREGYRLVEEADRTSKNPGEALRVLLNRYSPCLILVDEWVAYARQLHDDGTLPAGDFGTHFTFAQALAEEVRAARNALLVVSLPVSAGESPEGGRERISESEVGGPRGREALAVISNAVGRMDQPLRLATPEESFEIVRRRLFQPITDNALFVYRDQVARAFVDMYATQHQEFPAGCREAAYERRIKAAYPIHPALFDCLYDVWSSLERFQRTRGVLRLMAAVIHSLWEKEDRNLLIMPATVPMDDPRVRSELTRYLEENWDPILEREVDGEDSLPLSMDRKNPNLGRFSACRRVARTIFMGSAPLQSLEYIAQTPAQRGVEDRKIKLGCVQPGENVATFGDALRRLAERSNYLYQDGQRYWYSTVPTVTGLAKDRASGIPEEEVQEEIKRMLQAAAQERGDFCRVHACVPSPDVPDEREARLVILGPEYPHTRGEQDSPAMEKASSILKWRGNSPRIYKNTLVFLAPDRTQLDYLKDAVRNFLAWSSILRDRETLNLDVHQTRIAEKQHENAKRDVDIKIPETYIWLLVPEQPDPRGKLAWSETRLQGQDPLAVRASRRMRNDGTLLTQLGGVNLRHELDRIPLWRGDHVSLRQLFDDFATYVYLPRLRDDEVLVGAVRDGIAQMSWKLDTFAYAQGWDEEGQRHKGLVAGQHVEVIAGGDSLVVKPGVASRQMEEERKRAAAQEGAGEVAGIGTYAADAIAEAALGEEEVADRAPRRFHASVEIDPIRINRDVPTIFQEVIQHLVSLKSAELKVTLEIEAHIPEGAPEDTVRTVTENCNTLKFKTYGFEEE
ncbi:MAG: ATP-binding protein [Actinobacteria bacterium]|nr:ATP-binding protein [Actinomycetota bacterium]